jgi:hypothetical protein
MPNALSSANRSMELKKRRTNRRKMIKRRIKRR